MDTGATSGNQNTEGHILATGAKVTSIKLTNGITYQLAPLSLNMLIAFEEKYGELKTISTPSLKQLRTLLWLRLEPFDKDITEEEVGNLVDANLLIQLKGILIEV